MGDERQTLQHELAMIGMEYAAKGLEKQAATISQASKLLQEQVSIPEGAAFFKALKHGATFKWMELVQADAPQERLDAQSDLQILLAAVAKKAEEIEAMEARAALQTDDVERGEGA